MARSSFSLFRLFSPVFLCLIIAPLGCGGGKVETFSEPNILLIVVDTLRADHLETYGYSRKTMPIARQLANEGVQFDNAFSQAPWTGSSMTSLFTSVYPSTHGFLYNTLGGTTSNFVNQNLVTLAEALGEGGYHRVGHVTNLYVSRKMGFAQGFDKFLEHEHLADADAVTSAAINDLNGWAKKSESPLFMYVHYMEPHCPYSPPADYKKTFESESQPLPPTYKIPRHIDIGSRDLADYRNSYDEEILFANDQISRLLDELKKLSLEENTLVILTSDHGEELFERGNFGHGRTFHDEVLHIPLILRFPAKIPANKKIDTIVELVDVMPTVLDLADLQAPEQMQGSSLKPLLQAAPKMPESPEDRVAYSELFIKGPPRIMIRSRTMKAVCVTEGEPHLTSYFDLTKDPTESNNLVSTLDPSESEALVKQLVQWRVARTKQGAPYQTGETKSLTEQELQRLKDLGYIDDEE